MAAHTLHNLETAVLVAVVILAVIGICHTEPGGLYRALGGEHTGRHVRPPGSPRERHLPPLHSHAAPRGFAPSKPLAIAAPVAEDATTVPATIPDALNTVRTA